MFNFEMKPINTQKILLCRGKRNSAQFKVDFSSIYNYIKLNLNKISSIANLICLIDCVLIPIVTVVLSLINVVSDSQSDHGHTSEDGHHPEWHETVEKVTEMELRLLT
ncbi:conserved Plasmodium protein, unknown function [Plasmodium ovale]|uniref:Uncharacterized protein n=1 Tax=Plasmodium ovale TaxID=36330 RepID=A0A1C3KTF9_PLAOA|nr:conserved Plasmodium protein, unknown function [Plasmodium ovale]